MKSVEIIHINNSRSILDANRVIIDDGILRCIINDKEVLFPFCNILKCAVGEEKKISNDDKYKSVL